MAHVLTLTDGTTTINLTSGTTAFTTAYAPQTPELSMQDADVAAVMDGGEIPLTTRRNVTETVELVVVGATKAIMQTNAEAIERMLAAAERRQRWGMGGRVYLTAQFDGEASAWRSEILAGRLEITQQSMQLWTNSRIPARLYITRRWYWESTTLTALQLTTSANGTPTTSAVTLYVNDDATAAQTNWIQIASTQVGGTVPAPVKLQLTNTSGGAVAFLWWHLSNNAYAAPTTFDPFLLGSDPENVPGATETWGAGGTEHTTSAFAWPLGATRLAQMAGQYWRVLAAFASYPAGGMFVRANLRYKVGGENYYDLWNGEEIWMDSSKIQDLGAIPIPTDTGSTAPYLVVSVRAAGSGSAVMDFVQMQPAWEYRKLYQRGFSMPNGTEVVDDGTEGTVYYQSGTDHWPIYVGYGNQLNVYPGVTQRIRVLNDTGVWTAARTLTAQAWYRPRRLTI